MPHIVGANSDVLSHETATVRLEKVALIFPVLAIAMFWRALTTFFAVDDFVYLQAAATPAWPETLAKVFEDRFFSGQGAFAVTTALFGVRAWPSHALTLCLHVLNGLLVYRVFSRLAPRKPAIAAAASVTFLLHPVAYTPLAWLAAGFNEIPTLTLTLLATLLSVRFVERGSVPSAAGAIALVFAAAGFKQHAVVAPSYVIGIAAYFGFRQSGSRWTLALVVRLSVLALAFAAGIGGFSYYVLPAVAEKFTGPYERVLEPLSLAHSYAMLLWNSLNPVAFFRSALGYQAALPEALAAWPLVLSLTGLIPLVVAIAWAAARTDELPLACLLSLIVAAALAIPATMPRHLYEYYSYFSLPAAAGLLALPIVAIIRPGERGAHRGLRRLATATLCLLYALVAGELLHRSNRLLRQAENARAIDRLAGRVEPSGTLYFVPPVDTAVRDTVNGLSLRTLHADRGLKIEFATQPGVPDRFVQEPGVALVALDETDPRRAQAYRFDQAQWKTDRSTPLSFDYDIVQRVRAVADGLDEIQVLVAAPLPPCRIKYGVDRLGPPNVRVESVVEGILACPEGGAPEYVGLRLPHLRQSKGVLYRFRLRMAAGSDSQRRAIVFGSSQVPSAMFPVMVGDAVLQQHDATVAYRLILRID